MKSMKIIKILWTMQPNVNKSDIFDVGKLKNLGEDFLAQWTHESKEK